MIFFTTVDRETGQVLSSGHCYNPQLLASPEVIVIEGAQHPPGWLDAGGAHHPMPDQPSPWSAFDWRTKSWIDPRPPESLADAARANRRLLLERCDWTQLPDVPQGTREAWAAYRTQLRDVPEQPGFPLQIDWPIPPA